jgi:hypothetical protein
MNKFEIKQIQIPNKNSKCKQKIQNPIFFEIWTKIKIQNNFFSKSEQKFKSKQIWNLNKKSKSKQIWNLNKNSKYKQIPKSKSKSKQNSKSKQIWNLKKKSKLKTFFSKSEKIFKI